MLAAIIFNGTIHTVVLYLRELPLSWFLVGCLLAQIASAFGFSRLPQSRASWLRRTAFSAGLLVVLTYVAVSLYSLRCFMLQGDEANILSIAAESLHGPMYQLPHSPDSNYSLVYGPMTFIVYRIALIAGGVDHFWLLRGVVVLASLGLCAALYGILRKSVSAAMAVALLAFPLSALLQHPENSLGIRSDIWVILFAGLAMLCSLIELELAAVILTGVMGGILVGFKISAGPAILFPLLVLYRRFGMRALVLSSTIAAAAALAPFAAGNISLHNYLAWISFTGSEGISLKLLWPNAVFALFLIAPCLVMELCIRPAAADLKRRLPELSLIAFCLLIAVLTSKAGSGPWYLWHMIPSVVAYLAFASKYAADHSAGEPAVPVYFIAVACVLVMLANLPRGFNWLRMSPVPPSVALSRQAMDRYLDIYKDRSSIQMGYGSVVDDDGTLLRYVLVYQGQPYTLEGNVGRFDTMLLPIPANILKHMQTCTDDVWLVPRAQRPFSLFIFPDVLRQTFLANYSVDRSDAIYDAWVCNHANSR